MKLIVGLGNPGPEYAHTRHNIGFMAADAIAHANGFSPWTKKFKGAYSEGKIGGEKVLLLKPFTYMNLSGDSAVAATQFFKIPVDDVIVLHDELDILPGKLRVKKGGGAGGHNGLKSLDAHIGADYWRVRIGIGHPGNKDLVSPYVLSGMPREEEAVQEKMIEAIVRNIALMVAGDDAGFMTKVAAYINPPPVKKLQTKTEKEE